MVIVQSIVTAMDNNDIIDKLLSERQATLALPGGSQSKEYRKICSRLAYYQNPETRRKYLASLDPDSIREKNRARYAANPQRQIVANKAWRDSHPGVCTAASRHRRANHPTSAIADSLRSLMRVVGLDRRPKKIERKTPRFEKMVGCTRIEFQKYIESQFRSGMDWSNRGTHWEIDHIRPLIDFDLTQESECMAASHYANVRVVTRQENLAKGFKKI